MALETGSRGRVFVGYIVGAGLMCSAGVVAAFLGVAAEGKSLETLNAVPDLAGGHSEGARLRVANGVSRSVQGHDAPG